MNDIKELNLIQFLINTIHAKSPEIIREKGIFAISIISNQNGLLEELVK